MIKHIVSFRFKPEHKDKLPEARDRMLAMRGQIPGVVRIDAGLDFLHTERSFDLAIVVDLETRNDLKVYADHPVHAPVKAFLAGLYDQAVAVDFEF